jgi:hypothetical protein
MYNQTYSNKIQSCKTAIELIGVDPVALSLCYSGASFRASDISKSALFRQVVVGQLSLENEVFLNDRCNLGHFKDSRKGYEYGTDLILGWLIEDAILERIRISGRIAILSGEDRYREFLSPREISTQPDIRIGNDDNQRLLEVFADWKGHWRTKGTADLRDNKFNKLRFERALMLGISPTTSEGFVIDFSNDDAGFREAFIPAYGKTGYTTTRIQEYLQPLDKTIGVLLGMFTRD